ncbi:MAG TPA: Gfo/Idh/MocA family oxidoreductase [bacterium]|nr:Gfo/Idh/MocA family oxidoreductase [bacterium]
MKPLIPLGVVGGGAHAAVLADHGVPLPQARIARWAAGGDSRDRAAASALAEGLGVPFSADWDAVVRDPALRGILVLTPDRARPAIVAAALSAGKAVLCPAPAAENTDELGRIADARRRGGGVLMTGGALRHTPGGRTALAAVADGGLGALQTVYVAVRLPRPDLAPDPRGVLDRVGWEVADFLAAASAAPLVRVQALAGSLFDGGPEPDSAVLLLRFGGDVLATVELSRCLPRSLPTSVADVEIELVGTGDAIHVDPYRTAVRVYRDEGSTPYPWVDAPILSMVAELAAGIEEPAAVPDALPALERTIQVMEAARGAIARSVHREAAN